MYGQQKGEAFGGGGGGGETLALQWIYYTLESFGSQRHGRYRPFGIDLSQQDKQTCN